MAEALIQAADLVKGYRTAAGYVPVLTEATLEVAAGEMVAIVGASGVGKSTLLHVLGTLDRPESGRLTIAGRDVLRPRPPRLDRFRNESLGFVFQFHHLLPEFTALENVMMPMLIARTPDRGGAAAGGAPCSTSWAWPTGAFTGRGRSRAASSSGWRWPGPSYARPGPSSRTSPPGTSTRRPETGCTSCSVVSTRRRE